MIDDSKTAANRCTTNSPVLTERTIGGVHDFLARQVLNSLSPSLGPAVDLGAGSGALAVRLRDLGWDVLAADIDRRAYKADVPFVEVNLDNADFPSALGERSFGLVTSVEVIEHVESPIGFLRNIARLLKPGGRAVLTTPNVDNAPARLKFLLTGKLRMMDERADPTHISPIFWDLMQRQYLPRVGLRVVEHLFYPPHGYRVTRARFAWGMSLLTAVLPGDCLKGDNHVFVLQASGGK